MNRKIFMLLMVLALAVTGALLAQSTGTTTGSAVGTGNQNVDSSGQPEQTGLPDVDVDRHGDADTKAQGDGNATGTATGTAAGRYNNGTTGATTGTMDNTATTGGAYDNSANADADNANLPNTASDSPLLGLLGLLSLAGFVAIRAAR